MLKRTRRHLPPLLVGLLAALVGMLPVRADELTRQVQEELRKRHLYFGDVDGRFTPEVSAALRRYQERKGFSSSGTPDDTTLRSLTLLPPSPASRSAPPLPDITVLRSDEGHSASAHESDAVVLGTASWRDVSPPAEEVQPTPARLVTAQTPIPASPPASAAAVQRLDLAAVQAFVARYLQAGQTNDPAAELRFYGDQVDYFDTGVVDRQFIARDVSRFDQRWPERQFSLAGPVEIVQAPKDNPSNIEVRFRYRFREKGSHYSVVGQADTEYVLAGNRPDDLRIVAMKEQRVRP